MTWAYSALAERVRTSDRVSVPRQGFANGEGVGTHVGAVSGVIVVSLPLS